MCWRGEEQALIYPFDIYCHENTYRIIIRTRKESLSSIPSILHPLTDNEIELSYYIRRSVEGSGIYRRQVWSYVAGSNRSKQSQSFSIRIFWTTFGICSVSAADG